MSDLRLFGLSVSLLLAVFSVVQFLRRRFRRVDLLFGLVLSTGLATVSAFPRVVDGLMTLFQTPSRLLALAILGNLALFALFLYLLKVTSTLRSSVGELVRSLARAEYDRAARGPSSARIVVVIPAFNEEENLQQLLPRIPAEVDGHTVRALVIVDGARDASAQIAGRHGVPVTSHAIQRGGGDALRTGFELALQEGAEVIVTMDADGQHRPEEISNLTRPILRGEADVTLGNRFSGAYAERGSPRHWGIVGFSLLVSVLGGVRIHDCTNGYRAIRDSALAKLDLRERQFHTAEFILQAARNGFRIQEVPVSVMTRTAGRSKKPAGLRYPLGFLWTVLKVWLR